METIGLKKKSYDWTEKYRPQKLLEVVGHPTAIEELRRWAQSWEKGTPKESKEKALLLHGKPGTGKTSMVYALANDMGWEVVELNASDQRTAKVIQKVAGLASQMNTFEGKDVKKGVKTKRLIMLDEADNIYGREDRGGEKAIIDIIKKTDQPIILTANELYDMGIGLRNACKNIQFRSISGSSIAMVLKKIAESEGVVCKTGVIEKLVENASGDLRSAINDLQAIAQGKTEIEVKDLIMGERDTKENIFKVLGKIFKGTNILEARDATFGLDEDPESFIQWIDENLPLEYTKPVDLVEGYKYLGRASLFLGRVRRRQNYGMWRYASTLMTSGMVVARSGSKYTGYSKFQPPSIRRLMGQTKGTRAIRDSIAKKIGNRCHVSASLARSQLMYFFRMMMKSDVYAVSVAALLDLSDGEISYILTEKGGEKPNEKMVQKIYNDAQLLIEKDKGHDIDVFGGFGEYRKREEDREEIEDGDIEDGDIEDREEIEEREYPEEYIDNNENGIGIDTEKDIESTKEHIEDKEVKREYKKEFKKDVRKAEKSQKSLFDF